MVWIHGGAYTMGSGSSYNPSVLVAYHDVIVVSINYRLGVFGFFNIPGTDVKGNYGMHDQVLITVAK
jgi:carboxylesterase type B